MELIGIELSSHYKRAFRRLPLDIQKKAIEKINTFRGNPFNQGLKTHSLSGKEKQCWAFWIKYNYRIKCIFLSDKEVLFLDIGTHDIYK